MQPLLQKQQQQGCRPMLGSESPKHLRVEQQLGARHMALSVASASAAAAAVAAAAVAALASVLQWSTAQVAALPQQGEMLHISSWEWESMQRQVAQGEVAALACVLH